MILFNSFITTPIFVLTSMVTSRCLTGFFMWKMIENIRGGDKIYRLPVWSKNITDYVTIAGAIYTYKKLT